MYAHNFVGFWLKNLDFILFGAINQVAQLIAVMGKRRFNEKGRQQVETVIDDTSTKQVMRFCVMCLQ